MGGRAPAPICGLEHARLLRRAGGRVASIVTSLPIGVLEIYVLNQIGEVDSDDHHQVVKLYQA